MAQKQSKGSKSAGSRPANKEQTPSRFSGQDVLHVILIGLVCTVIFAGIGVAISMSKGITAGTGSGGGGVQVADNGTPIPTIPPTATATEIPCESQAWWDAISAQTATVINNVQNLSVDTPPQQIKAGQDAANNWKTTLDSATDLAPCVQTAHQSLVTAATETATVYGLYLSTSTQIQRAQEVLRAMDIYLGVSNELENLKVTVSEDWFTSVRDFKNGDCPVRRWYIQQFIVRDYQRYFTDLSNINIQRMTAGDLQTSLIDLRTLSTSFKTDLPGFPDCIKDASTNYTNSIDSAIRAVNEALNGNLGVVNNLLVTAVSDKNAFQLALTQLDPKGMDPKSLNL